MIYTKEKIKSFEVVGLLHRVLLLLTTRLVIIFNKKTDDKQTKGKVVGCTPVSVSVFETRLDFIIRERE